MRVLPRSTALRRLFLAIVLLGALLAAKIWHDTMRDPVVRRLALDLPILPPGSEAVRIVLLADIHVAGPDMPPSRLARIVEQVNALEPDIVLIAGDFVSDKRTASRTYSVEEAIAPLGDLDPSTVKLAVPGNHDHWRDVEGIAEELAKHRIGVLRNQVANARGVLVAGLDDDFTGHADLPRVLGTLEDMGRPGIVLSHSPDPFPDLPSAAGLLMLAGHTHCGQIAWPWGGSPATMSRYGQRYACGVVRENGNLLLTASGLGTSVLPFRLFTQPEVWVVEVGPAK